MKGKGIIFVLIVIAAIGAVSWVVMTLWNYSVAPVLEVKTLSYLQAMALLVLMRILVGGFRPGHRNGSHGPGVWRKKWKDMSDEKKKKYKEEWKNKWHSKKTDNQIDSIDSDNN